MITEDCDQISNFLLLKTYPDYYKTTVVSDKLMTINYRPLPHKNHICQVWEFPW